MRREPNKDNKKVRIRTRNNTEYIYEILPHCKEKVLGKLDPKQDPLDPVAQVFATHRKQRGNTGAGKPKLLGYYVRETRTFTTDNPIKRRKDKLPMHLRALRNRLNEEQRIPFNWITAQKPENETLFISGSGGAGKTDLLATSWLAMRLSGKSVLVMSYTGIAAYETNRKLGQIMEELGIEHKISYRLMAGTIHSKLQLKELQWFDTETLCNNVTIKTEQEDLEKKTLKNKGEMTPKRAYDEKLADLSKYDVIMLDEASMISSNMMDTILGFKEDAEKLKKEPIRVIMFGDFYQLKPVIGDMSHGSDLEKHYNENYNGCTSLFASKRLSAFQSILFYELKQNHRINEDKGLSEKRLENNRRYKRSLEEIKIAGETLLKAFGPDCENRVECLKGLNDAISFINRSARPYAKFKQLRSVRSLPEGEYPIIITGRNKARAIINRHIAKGSMEEGSNRVTIKTEIFSSNKYLAREENQLLALYELIGIPVEYEFYEGMPIIFIKTVRGKGKCFNGRMGRIKTIVRKDNAFESMTIDMDGEESAPIMPENIQLSSRKIGGDVVIRKMPFDPAFALTFHKVQGQSLKAVYIRTSKGNFLDSNSLYVGLSRGRDFSALGISKKLPEPLKRDGTVNIRNCAELFVHYFKLGRFRLEYNGMPRSDYYLEKKIEDIARNGSDQNSPSWFLSDIKKDEPEKYKNWRYRCFDNL